MFSNLLLLCDLLDPEVISGSEYHPPRTTIRLSTVHLPRFDLHLVCLTTTCNVTQYSDQSPMNSLSPDRQEIDLGEAGVVFAPLWFSHHTKSNMAPNYGIGVAVLYSTQTLDLRGTCPLRFCIPYLPEDLRFWDGSGSFLLNYRADPFLSEIRSQPEPFTLSSTRSSKELRICAICPLVTGV